MHNPQRLGSNQVLLYKCEFPNSVLSAMVMEIWRNQHKFAAIRFLYNRLNSYQLDRDHLHPKLFKRANLKIAYRTSNNIPSYLSLGPHSEDIFAQSGVYKLTCPDCGKTYVGQTGRDLRTRFNEHKCSTTTRCPNTHYIYQNIHITLAACTTSCK